MFYRFLTTVFFSILIAPNLFFSQTTLIVGTPQTLTQINASTQRCEVEITDPSEIAINLQGWQNTLNWDTDFDRIYIYNSNLEPIGIEIFGSVEDPFLFHMMYDPDSLTIRVGKAGTYYIDFHSGNNWGWPDGKTEQNYTVLITTIPVNDVYEPNDDLASATLVNFDTPYTAYQWISNLAENNVTGDEDYYLCNVPSSGKLKILLSETWNSVYNWGADFDRLYIYDENGSAIGGTGDDPYYSWMMSGGEISFDIENAGNYTVRLHSGWAYSTNPYSVTFSFESTTDVKGNSNFPNEFSLSQNFPNPFNPTTTIQYTIPTNVETLHATSVHLKVYDILGNKIATLVNEAKFPGVYEVQFDASNFSSGIYYYKLISNNFIEIKKMLLIK